MKNLSFVRLLASSGLIFLILLLSGLVIAGFVPPVSPSLSLENLAQHYADNSVGAKLFGFFLVWCSPLYVTFSVAIASYMRRASASFEMVASQIGMSVLGGATFLVSGVLFVAIAFRAEEFSPTAFILNDLAWIIILLPWPSFLIQNFIIGIAIINDPRKKAPIPQWVAYVNFWVAISFIPSTLLCFFKTGPFAWNGLLVFWLAAGVFTLWFLVMSYYLFVEIRSVSPPEKSS